MCAEDVMAALDALEAQGFEIHSMILFYEDFKRWDSNDKVTIVVDAGGTVYTRAGDTTDEKTLEIIQKICEKGKGTFTTNFLLLLLENPTPSLLRHPL